MKKSAALFKLNIENLKTLQRHTILKKNIRFQILQCDNKDEKYFMKKIQLKY